MLRGLFTGGKLYLYLWLGLKFTKSLSFLKYGKHVLFSIKTHQNILKALVQPVLASNTVQKGVL